MWCGSVRSPAADALPRADSLSGRSEHVQIVQEGRQRVLATPAELELRGEIAVLAVERHVVVHPEATPIVVRADHRRRVPGRGSDRSEARPFRVLSAEASAGAEGVLHDVRQRRWVQRVP